MYNLDRGSQRDEGSCRRALDAVRLVRERLEARQPSRAESVLAEQRANFSSYGSSKRSKKSTTRSRCWTLKAVCLSSRNACQVPCTLAQREALVEAGLGEKRVVILDIDSCSTCDFKAHLIETFQKLDGCGGFDLLRCLPNSKSLEFISTTIAQSPKLLKSVIGNGKVYIRPIQKDLKLEVDDKLALSSQVMGRSMHELK